MSGEVAIYCGPGWRRFSADDIERRGLGGSETAAIRVAQHLADDFGHRVTVYGDVLEGRVGGVNFRDWRGFDPEVRREALIASRVPEVADVNPNSRVRLLWAHDVDFGSRLTPERAACFDRVLCLSEWQLRHLASLYPFCADKLGLVRNGIQLSYFEGPPVERATRVLSTSAPDRGLVILLELWPQVRAEVPEAVLSYAYCDVYDRIAAERPGLEAQIERAEELSRQPGVTALGSLPQPAIAQLMRESLVWVHPSFSTAYDSPMHETSCIGAIEAQAAGCCVVVSNWGALPETVKAGRFVSGEPGSAQWRSELVSEIVRGLVDPDTQARAQREGPDAASRCGWSAPPARSRASSMSLEPRASRAPRPDPRSVST